MSDKLNNIKNFLGKLIWKPFSEQRNVSILRRLSGVTREKRFLVLIENSNKLNPSQRNDLLEFVRKKLQGFDWEVKNLRTGSYYLEFDIWTRTDINGVLEILSYLGKPSDIRDLTKTEKFTKEKAFETAVKLFNEERFWEFHEILEGVWRDEKSGENS